MIDLRFAAFVRITRDPGLRSLLVNYADRLDHERGGREAPCDTCFLALKWAPDGRVCAPVGSQLLTARVHMPCRGADPLFLDVVLERLGAALAADTADEPVTSRCIGTTPTIVDTGVEMICKASTFEISPAVPRRAPPTLRRLQPWTAAPAHPAVHAGAGVPSMN